MLDEMLIVLVRAGLYGGDVDRIADMDMLSFQAAAEASMRVAYSEKAESAWTAMVAAQGDTKTMKRWTGRWHNAISKTSEEAAPTDEKAFIQRVRRGIR